MTTTFLMPDQLKVAKSLFATGQALRSEGGSLISRMRQLRAAMPFAPMLFDQDTTLEGRIQIVRSLDNESLAYTAALLGIDPITFPDKVTLRPSGLLSRVLQAVADINTYPAAPTASALPSPVELETLTSMHLSDTFPLVRLRAIFDGASSGRVSYQATLAELTRFAPTDGAPVGWVSTALRGTAIVSLPALGWTYQVMSLYGTPTDPESLVDVYMANLRDPRQMMTMCRAVLTAYDIQSVSGRQSARHHLVQRVHDYTVARNTAGDPTMFVLCSHQPGQLQANWTSPAFSQALMATEALNSSLDLRIGELNIQTCLKVLPHNPPMQVQIGEWKSAQPTSGSIRLLLPALAHTAYVRHPAPTDFGAYQWVNRMSPNQADWNGVPLVNGINPPMFSAVMGLFGAELLSSTDFPNPVKQRAGPSDESGTQAAGENVDFFPFSKSDYLYIRQFTEVTVQETRSRKRGFGSDE